jgi:hypothetical protein
VKKQSAKSNFDILKKACKEIRDELINLHNEKNSLEKWLYEFKHSNDDYLEVQNIVKEKVDAFLTEYNGRKLLEFALTAAAEALRQDPQRETLAEKTSSLMNYDYDPETLFFPNPYDYSDLEKEKLFVRASEIYDKLVKGLLMLLYQLLLVRGLLLFRKTSHSEPVLIFFIQLSVS